MQTKYSISIDLPQDVLKMLNENIDEAKRQIKLDLAIRLFRQNKLTLGKSAQLANISRTAFEKALADQGFPISNLDFEDVMADLKKLMSDT